MPDLIAKWESILKVKVKVNGYFQQGLKNKLGSSNPGGRTTHLDTELMKKPKDLLEYVGPPNSPPDRVHTKRTFRRDSQQAILDVARGEE